MKYFIGIPAPENIKSRIISFQKDFMNIKVPFITELHITVKTPTGLNDDELWVDVVKNEIKKFYEFEVLLKDVDTFGEDVLFIKPSTQKDLFEIHKRIVEVLKINSEIIEKNFEGESYNAHLTIARTKWGIPGEEITALKEKFKNELPNLMPFKVSFIRIYKKENSDNVYKKFIDIPLLNKEISE